VKSVLQGQQHPAQRSTATITLHRVRIKKVPLYFQLQLSHLLVDFLQRGRISCNAERCISHGNPVCLSVGPSHAGALSRRMKIGSRGLHCRVAIHSSFLTPTMVGGRRPLPFKIFAQSDPPPLCSADFHQYLPITSQP